MINCKKERNSQVVAITLFSDLMYSTKCMRLLTQKYSDALTYEGGLKKPLFSLTSVCSYTVCQLSASVEPRK